ncbi:MAG: RNA polymerase sigma factor [Eggerthellaceae bacterium]
MPTSPPPTRSTPTSGRSWARCRPTCASRCTCSTSSYATEEIARITGCRPSTVRTRLHRAREQLRNMLEDDRGQRESRPCKLPRPLCRKEPNRDRSPQPRPTPNRG